MKIALYLLLFVSFPMITLCPERPFTDLDSLTQAGLDESETTPLIQHQTKPKPSAVNCQVNNEPPLTADKFALYKDELQRQMFREHVWYFFNYPQSYQVYDAISLQNFAQRYIQNMHSINLKLCKGVDYTAINQQLTAWRNEVMMQRINEFNHIVKIREQKAKTRRSKKINRAKKSLKVIVVKIYINKKKHSTKARRD